MDWSTICFIVGALVAGWQAKALFTFGEVVPSAPARAASHPSTAVPEARAKKPTADQALAGLQTARRFLSSSGMAEQAKLCEPIATAIFATPEE